MTLGKTYILFLALSLFVIVEGSSKTIVVCHECEVSSIQQAIEMASPGDIIQVKKGVYYEAPLIIDKVITLEGIDYPILDGRGENEIIQVISDSVTIRGMQLQNVGQSYLEDKAAIRVIRKKHFSILNNKILNAFFGIYLEHADNGVVAGNTVTGEAIVESASGNAIHAWYCSNILIKDNQVSYHRDGIYFEFVDSSLIEGNLSENNLRYGLHFMFSDNDIYEHNTFRGNGAGVAVMFSKFITMQNNLFEHNWGQASFGLLLKEIYDAEIRSNRFIMNTIGIFVEGSTRINYSQNVFQRNGWAIKMSGGCLQNKIEYNDFVSNSLDLVVNSKVNDNTFQNNYWSEYSGYDLDKDGIGDVPHRPVKLYSYILDKIPEAIVLMRSLFVDLINFSEKVSPVLTPKGVLDDRPLMHPAT